MAYHLLQQASRIHTLLGLFLSSASGPLVASESRVLKQFSLSGRGHTALNWKLSQQQRNVTNNSV